MLYYILLLYIIIYYILLYIIIILLYYYYYIILLLLLLYYYYYAEGYFLRTFGIRDSPPSIACQRRTIWSFYKIPKGGSRGELLVCWVSCIVSF